MKIYCQNYQVFARQLYQMVKLPARKNLVKIAVDVQGAYRYLDCVMNDNVTTYDTETLKRMAAIYVEGSPHQYRAGRKGLMQVKYSYKPDWEDCDPAAHALALHCLRRREWFTASIMAIRDHGWLHATLQGWIKAHGTALALKIVEQHCTGAAYVNTSLQDMVQILMDEGYAKYPDGEPI